MRLFSLILCIFFAAVAAKTELDTLLMTAALSESDPTAEPSAAPTLRPTKMPTAVPTTAEPSMVPTAVPTVMPTPINLVKFEAKQTLSGVSPEDYLANKAAVDLTLQNAIAATMTGVQPEDITDIGIDESESGGRRLAGGEVHLRYMVITHVDGATYDSLIAQLTAASETSALNDLIQEFADEFGVPVLADATVSEPETTNLLADRGTSELLTGTQIAGLIIGIFLCLGLIATVVFFILNVRNDLAAAAGSPNAGPSPAAPVTSSTTLELTNQV